MERRLAHRAAPNGATVEPTDHDAALRDAADIVERRCGGDARAADESAATAARSRYRSEPLPTMVPDSTIGPLLKAGEQLITMRRDAILERRQAAPGASGVGLTGNLYLTSARLVFRSRFLLTLRLDEIEEVVLSGDRLLLVMNDGSGMAVDVDRPQLLRVEIAAARAALRT